MTHDDLGRLPARPLAWLGVVLLFSILALFVLQDAGTPRSSEESGAAGSVAAADATPASPAEPGAARRVERSPEPDGDTVALAASAATDGEVLVLRTLQAARDAVDGHWTSAGGLERSFRLDPGGRVARVRLPAGSWRLDVPGWLAEPTAVLVDPSTPRRIELVPSRGGSFRVMDGDHPLPGVAVHLVARDEALAPDWRWDGTTSSDGRFFVPSLPGGEAYAFLVAPDGRLVVETIEAPPEGEVEVVPFVTKVEPIPIRVVDAATSLPVTGARCFLASFPDLPFATSGPDGAVTLPARSSSLSNFEVVADGYAPSHTRPDELEEDEGVRILPLTPGAEAGLKLLTPKGRPVAGATVFFLVPSDSGAANVVRRAVSDKAGHVRILLPKEPPAGSLLVALHEGGWWGRLAPPPSPRPAEIAWPLEEPRPLVLAFADGPAPADRAMLATSHDGTTHDLRAEDGVFRILAPFLWRGFLVPTPSGGMVRLDLAPDSRTRWRWFVEGRPEVLAGRIVLPDRQGHRVRLRFVTWDDAPLADWPVSLEQQTREVMLANHQRWPDYHGHAPSGVEGWVLSANPLRAEGLTDDNGEIELEGLAEGDHAVRIATPDSTRAFHPIAVAPGVPLLRVPLPETVEIRLEASLDLELTVLDEAGRPIPEFRLQAADGPFEAATHSLVGMGLDGSFSDTFTLPPTTRYRVVALGRQPFEFSAPPTPGPPWTTHHEIVRMAPLAPMLVTLADDAPEPIHASVMVRDSKADRETGLLLAHVQVDLVPGQPVEVPGTGDGCWVEIFAPGKAFSPDGFTWHPGSELTLRLVDRDSG